MVLGASWGALCFTVRGNGEPLKTLALVEIAFESTHAFLPRNPILRSQGLCPPSCCPTTLRLGLLCSELPGPYD
jgi:hypothetical protein